jgi:S-layer protein (TIGR01567 family)
MNQDIGREMIIANVTEGRVLRGEKPYGLHYETSAQRKKFEFEDWGYYNVIGFLGNKYFVEYIVEDSDPANNSYLSYKSEDKNLMEQEQLTEVLIDEDEEKTIPMNKALELSEGYKLICTRFGSNDKITVDLYKNSNITYRDTVDPSNKLAQKHNFIYKKDLNGTTDIVILAVHFKDAFEGSDQDYVTLDGIWQISEKSLEIEPGTHYDKMTITDVNPNSLKITMFNKNKKISLNKDKTRRIIYRSSNVPWVIPIQEDEDVPIMGNIKIKVADNDTLRYCLLHDKSLKSINPNDKITPFPLPPVETGQPKNTSNSTKSEQKSKSNNSTINSSPDNGVSNNAYTDNEDLNKIKNIIESWFSGVDKLIGLVASIITILVYRKTRNRKEKDSLSMPSRPIDLKPAIIKSITVNATNNHHTVSPGGYSHISVLALVNNQSLPDANVTISAERGYFEDTSTTVTTGKTDHSGIFRATWHTHEASVNDGDKSYILKINVEKLGYVAGQADLEIFIKGP